MSHLYQPSLDQHDAFGRLRTSSPLTLFDSSHRYRDNNLWTNLIVGTGSTVGFVTTQVWLILVLELQVVLQLSEKPQRYFHINQESHCKY